MITGATLLCATSIPHPTKRNKLDVVIDSNWTKYLFIAAMGLIAAGYTGSVSMVIHIYTQVLANASERKVPAPPSAVGWLSTCGTVARVLGPVSAAYLLLFTEGQPFWLMMFTAVVPFVVVVCVVAAYRNLPP
jgi:MFS family permease